MLIDAFINEKNPAYRNKFRTIFSCMKDDIIKETIDRLEYSDPSNVKDLFSILMEYASQKAHLIAKKLIRHDNARIRWEGLDVFKPENEEEKNSVLDLLRGERNEEVKKKAATVLLLTRDADMIEKLFAIAEKGFFVQKFLIRLVELCGSLKIYESFPSLKRVFLKRPFFSTKSRNDLRAAAVSSLARLHTDEAMQLVDEGLKDKSEAVRRMSEIILKLTGKTEAEKPIDEGDKNAGE
jgi:hypothetical protein